MLAPSCISISKEGICMTNKKMGIAIIAFTLFILILIGSAMIILDPYFHYHAPFEWQRYHLENQRYQNDGIIKNFEYTAVITGTSMTENFMASECDNLFGVKTIKTPFFGGSLKEINQAVKTAIDNNSDLKMVIRSLDTYKFFEDKDFMSYDDYPEYLYDENIFNDVSYILNKDVIINNLIPVAIATLKKMPSTTFDAYSNWNNTNVFGKEVVLSNYDRPLAISPDLSLSDEDKKTIKDNVYQNLIQTAEENPEIDFYYFIPPYSIAYWDSLKMNGNLKRSLECQKFAIEMMLETENIHLFSFASDYGTVTNLNLFKDLSHYNESVNSKILNHMANDEYRLTKENCNEYFDDVYQYYTSYDYNSIFQ